MADISKMTKAELQQQRERMEKLREMLKKKSDRAYCDYIDQLRKPECLGWEAKIKAGKFGEAELNAHEKAQELLGRHISLAEAGAALEELALEK